MAAPSLRPAVRTVTLASQTDFAGWRDAARRLALEAVHPTEVVWQVAGEGAGDLFAATARGSDDSDVDPPPFTGEGDHVEHGGGGVTSVTSTSTAPAPLHVPRAFVERAERVICHSDPCRFAFLYRMLWRLRDEPELLHVASDPDLRRFEAMEKAVRRDLHKMRAFVRFREVGSGDGGRFVAWFEPDHFIVERNAPFFAGRFTGMRWAILTPRGSVEWDGEDLQFGPPAKKSDAPAEDGTEELWRTYFQSIFNPARLKVKAMQAEMPKKYWKNLPEAALIPRLVGSAGKAATEMIAKTPTAPAPHHAKVQARHWPERPNQGAGDGSEAAVDIDAISALRALAEGCRRCPLWADATQTVFGEGPGRAEVVFVGEQPGDQEDIAGKPFVGPAGKVFDAVLAEAGIDRGGVYVTNGVKHFKFEPRGKRRIHAKPNAGEIHACRWWLDNELRILKPRLAVALGATAIQSLLGKALPVTKMRGRVVEREDGLKVFLTIHPSFILRLRDPAERDAERARFLADLVAVKALMEGH